MPEIVVLYEDKLSKDARSPSGYSLHQFVMHCAADRMGVDPWSLKNRIKGLPRNGVPRLKSDIESPDKLRPHGQSLVFVADSDEVHTHFGIPRSEPEDMCRSILVKAGNPEGIQFFLLVQNLEDLVEAAARKINRTVQGKSHLERDGILGALLDPIRATDRKALVEEVRMLREIVEAITNTVADQGEDFESS